MYKRSSGDVETEFKYSDFYKNELLLFLRTPDDIEKEDLDKLCSDQEYACNVLFETEGVPKKERESKIEKCEKVLDHLRLLKKAANDLKTKSGKILSTDVATEDEERQYQQATALAQFTAAAYTKYCDRFIKDEELWTESLNFLKEWMFYIKYCTTLMKYVKMHPNDNELALEGLTWLYNEGKPELVKELFLIIMEHGQTDKRVPIVYIMQLFDVSRMSLKLLERFTENSSSEKVESSYESDNIGEKLVLATMDEDVKKIITVYKSCLAKCKKCGFDFMKEVLMLCNKEEHYYTIPIQRTILDDMMDKYYYMEEMYYVLAMRELAGFHMDDIRNDIPSEIAARSKDPASQKGLEGFYIREMGQREKFAIKIFHKALEFLNTTKMWTYFSNCFRIDTKKIKSKSDYTTLKKGNQFQVLMFAMDAKRANKEALDDVIELVKEYECNIDEGIRICEKFIAHYENEAKYWEAYATLLANANDCKRFTEVFKRAAEVLTFNSVGVWKIAIDYYHAYVEYKDLLHKYMSIACSITMPGFYDFRLLSLDICLAEGGISSARENFAALFSLEPQQPDLTYKMIEFEMSVVNPDLKLIKKLFERLFPRFLDDQSLWESYLKFIITECDDPDYFEVLAKKACKNLGFMKFGDFFEHIKFRASI